MRPLSNDDELMNLLKQAPRYRLGQQAQQNIREALRKHENSLPYRRKRQTGLLWMAKSAFVCLSLLIPFFLIVHGSEDEHIPFPEVVRMTTRDIGDLAHHTLAKLYREVPELKGLTVQSESLDTVYDLRLYKAEDQQAHISIHPQTGELLWYQFNQRAPQLSPMDPSTTLAKTKATSFLYGMLGADSRSYKIISNSHAVVFQRFINGIPLLGSQISIQVDSTGKVIGYSTSGRDMEVDLAKAADPADAISVEALKKSISSHMRLRYVENIVVRNPFTGEVAQTGPILEYTPAVRFSGSVSFYADSGKIRYTSNYDRDSSQGVTPIPVRAAEQMVAVPSKKEAAILLNQAFHLQISSEDLKEKKEKRGDTKSYIRYVWAHDESVSVLVDPTTGELVEILKGPPSIRGNLPEQKAAAEAIRYLQQYADPFVREVQIAHFSHSGNEGMYSYFFMASHEGIPVVLSSDQDIAYRINIDSSTGAFLGFQKFHVPAKALSATNLPSKKQVVSPEAAAAEYLKRHSYQLAYLVERGSGSGSNAPVLMYTSELNGSQERSLIDATTGKTISIQN